MRAKSGIEIKTPEQIAAMRRAGLVVARTLQVLREAVKPGTWTHWPPAKSAAPVPPRRS
jgi:methionyl aminopeptidase